MNHIEIPDLWRTHDERVKPYVWNHRAVSWSQSALSLALVWNGIFLGWADNLQQWGSGLTDSTYGRWLLFFAVLGIFFEAVGIPFDMAHFRIERDFGLAKQTWGSWFIDKVKTWAVGGVIGAIALSFLFLSVILSPDNWWFIACTLLVGLSIVLAQLAPVVLIPLFYKLKPMEDGPLKQRLLALCERFHIEVKDVFHLGMGEKTEKGNAAFTGLGRTKRILIGDTLYERYPADEVEAVFAHELGHQVHNDLWKGIFLSASGLYLNFFLAQLIHTRFVLPYFEASMRDPMGLFLFFIVLGVIQAPWSIFQAVYSRSREHMADRFAHETIRVGKPLANALEKLTLQNFGFFRPNAVLEFLTYSHPAPWRRLRYLRQK